jgi:hypothetical protein
MCSDPGTILEAIIGPAQFAVLFGKSLMFRRNISPPSSGWKLNGGQKPPVATAYDVLPWRRAMDWRVLVRFPTMQHFFLFSVESRPVLECTQIIQWVLRALLLA